MNFKLLVELTVLLVNCIFRSENGCVTYESICTQLGGEGRGTFIIAPKMSLFY